MQKNNKLLIKDLITNLKIIPPVIVVFCLLLQKIISKFDPWYLPSTDFLGYIVLFICILALAYIAWLFYRNQTTIEPLHTPKKLITNHIYKYSRNPIYFVLALMLIATALIFNSPLALLVVPLYILIITHSWIKYEEEKLSKIFGKQYKDYCQKTRRFI